MEGGVGGVEFQAGSVYLSAGAERKAERSVVVHVVKVSHNHVGEAVRDVQLDPHLQPQHSQPCPPRARTPLILSLE